MKPKHIWVIEDEEGRPYEGMGCVLCASTSRRVANNFAKYFSEVDQTKYHPVKYAREK